MNTEYFLGANSSRGFYSLYSEFCSGEDDYLHIIKGGPGTGKSGFMRRIGMAAEAQGHEVEYVLCSGDPNSLDGIYIPALHKGWVDGTAPHVTEPRCFGYNSDYVNLGHFCKTPLDVSSKDYVNQLNQRYKACYSSAYDYLKAAALLRKNSLKSSPDARQLKEIHRNIQEILNDCTECQGSRANFIPRFMHAICCKGDLYLSESISTLCKQNYVIQFDVLTNSAILRTVAELASAHVSKLIVCLDPLEPELFEAVLLPEHGLSFVSAAYKTELDGELLQGAASAPHTADGSTDMENRVRNMALDRLRQAKELHDELEGFYKSAMDFAALDEFTEDYIKTAVE